MQNRMNKLPVLHIIKWIVLIFLALIMVVPFIWMISVGFERYANINTPFPPTLIPNDFSFFNFKLALENGYIFTAYTNSLIVAIGTVALSVGSALMAGYAFSKGEFRGKKILFYAILATMMIPLETRLIPMYNMIKWLNLRNSFWAIILPGMLYGFGVLLSKQFFDKLPDSLREAAYIDGSGEAHTFLKIYLPHTGPITATMCILAFIANWNSFVWHLVVLNDQESRTIPIFLSAFSSEAEGAYAGASMAVATLAVIPVIIIFLFFQKYIIRSIALSGLKGE